MTLALSIPTSRLAVAAVTVPVARREYSSAEVCRVAGVTYRQLDGWCRHGVVAPSVPARGTGSCRRFSGRDLLIVEAVARMSALGAEYSALRALSVALRAADLEALPIACFVTTAGRVYIDRVPDLAEAGGAWAVLVGSAP